MNRLNNINLGLLFLRLSTGGLILFHGISKMINGIDFIVGMLASKGIPAFIAYGVYAGEVIAPIAIIIGFRTRVAASVLLFNMFVIIFIVEPQNIFAINQFGGWMQELAGLFFFGALALLFTGGGKYSISSQNKWD